MEKLELIKDCAKTLKLNNLSANASTIIENADVNDLSYQDLLLDILKSEVNLKYKQRRSKSVLSVNICTS